METEQKIVDLHTIFLVKLEVASPVCGNCRWTEAAVESTRLHITKKSCLATLLFVLKTSMLQFFRYHEKNIQYTSAMSAKFL